jgi:hypothetical protein
MSIATIIAVAAIIVAFVLVGAIAWTSHACLATLCSCDDARGYMRQRGRFGLIWINLVERQAVDQYLRLCPGMASRGRVRSSNRGFTSTKPVRKTRFATLSAAARSRSTIKTLLKNGWRPTST